MVAVVDVGVLERRQLVVVVVVVAGDAGDGVLELAHALAERAPDLGQLLRAEHDQGDDQDDQQLGDADVGHEPRG